MLTMMDINAQLKENMQNQLQEVKELPEDLAIGYKDWVRGLVKQAAQQIQAEAQPQPQLQLQQEDGQMPQQ